jgi:hypothetical protein
MTGKPEGIGTLTKIDDVTVFQFSVIRDAVADHFVDRADEHITNSLTMREITETYMQTDLGNFRYLRGEG